MNKAGYSINGSLEKYNQLLSEDGYYELLNQQANDNFDNEDMFCEWVKEEAYVKNIFYDPQNSYDKYCQWVFDKTAEIFCDENNVKYYNNSSNTTEEDEKLEQAEILDDFYDFEVNILATKYEI